MNESMTPPPDPQPAGPEFADVVADEVTVLTPELRQAVEEVNAALAAQVQP